MADTKVTALSAIGTLGDDDLFYVVDDPGGTPLSRKATAAVVQNYALQGGATVTTGLTVDANVDASITWRIDNASVGSSSAASFQFEGGTTGFRLNCEAANPNVVLETNDNNGLQFSAGGRVQFRTDDLTGGSHINFGPEPSSHILMGSFDNVPQRRLHVEEENATTNAVTYLERLQIKSSGTPANGIGSGIEFQAETGDDNHEIGATIEAYTKDVTSTSEDFGVRIKTMTAGAAAATALDFSLPGTVYPQGHIFGLTMSNAADTSNDITIAAGEAVDETGTWNMTLAGAVTKQMDATWAVGTAAGGMANNGVGEAVSTWYEVLLIGREDTRVVDVAFSTTANRAVLPTNYTHKRRIGWVRNDGSSNLLQFTQIDDHFTWTTQINDGTASVTATAAAITMTVPPSSIARFRASQLITALALAAECVTVFSEIVEGNVTPAGSTGIASLGSGGQNATSANNDFTSAGHFELRVSATSTIEFDCTLGSGAAGTFDCSTYGFIDHRRRMSAT